MRPRAHVIVAALVTVLALGATACGSGSDEASGPTRTVTTAEGTVKVPLDPKRVVVLDTPELDAAITLGVKPVGSTRDEASSGFSFYLGDRTKGITQVGLIGEPNLEAIAKLAPDLILSTTDRDGERYDQLSAIAPTVLGSAPGARWKQNFLLYADALGKGTEGRAKLAAYTARATSIGKQLGDPGATTVSIVRFLPDETRLYTPSSYSGTILADVGVTRPKASTTSKDISITISNEQLDLANADVVYATFYGPKAGTTYGSAAALWAKVPAVAAGRVHEVDDRIWMTGIGITGANLVLDDLAKTLKRG